MRFPDWRPARDRYEVEMHCIGPTGRYLGVWTYKAVPFETAIGLIERCAGRRDVGSLKMRRLPPRARRSMPTRERRGLDFLLGVPLPVGSTPPAAGGPPPDFED